MANVNHIQKTVGSSVIIRYYEDTAGRNLMAAEQDQSLVAVKDYAIGELFWYNDLLYKTKVEITTGDTITLATDAENTTISAEMIALYGEVTEIKEKKASIDLLDDTTGWDCRNEYSITLASLKAANIVGTWSGNTYTNNGVVFTITTNSEGYVTEIDANNTATGGNAILLLGNPNVDNINNTLKLRGITGGSNTTYYFIKRFNNSGSYVYGNNVYNDTNNDIEQTYPMDMAGIIIYQGYNANHLKFNPMICKSEYAGLPYKPYHPSVSDWGYTREEANVLGAKNLVDVKSEGNKATCTVNYDSGIFTINGTTSQAVSFVDTKFNLPAGDYILSGCDGGASNTFFVDVYESYSDWSSNRTLNYSGDTPLHLTTDGPHRLRIYAGSGIAFTNKVFKPMIRLASDISAEFQPFAMPNKQLTQAVTVQESACTNIVSGASVETTENGGNVLQKVGNIVFCHLTLSGVTATAWSTYLADIPSGYIPKYDTRVASYVDGKVIKIGTDGHIQTSVNLSANKVGISTSWITS